MTRLDVDDVEIKISGWCRAYPGGIPKEIFNNQLDHREPQAGDNGIMFETDLAADSSYLALIMNHVDVVSANHKAGIPAIASPRRT